MKIKLSLIVMALMASSATAETYKLTVNSNHIKESSITLRNTEGDIIPKCTLPEILNEAKNACINPTPECTLPNVLNEAGDACVDTIQKVGWVYDADTCNGMRQANFDPNVYFVRYSSNNINRSLEIPEGYHWVSKSEYATLFNNSTVSNKSSTITPYRYQCGLGNYPISSTGQNQFVFVFSDSGNQGMHAGNYEYHGVTHQSYDASTGFAGYVLYKDF